MADNFYSKYSAISSGSGGGGGVTSLNSITGALTLVAGSGITITPSGSNITIASSGSSGANTALSNLTSPTAVNQSLIPGVTSVNKLNQGASSPTTSTYQFGTSGSHSVAASFTTSGSITISAVEVTLSGPGSNTGQLQAAIYDNSLGGPPSLGVNISGYSNPVNASTITTKQVYTFQFPSSTTLSASTVYWVILTAINNPLGANVTPYTSASVSGDTFYGNFNDMFWSDSSMPAFAADLFSFTGQDLGNNSGQFGEWQNLFVNVANVTTSALVSNLMLSSSSLVTTGDASSSIVIGSGNSATQNTSGNVTLQSGVISGNGGGSGNLSLLTSGGTNPNTSGNVTIQTGDASNGGGSTGGIQLTTGKNIGSGGAAGSGNIVLTIGNTSGAGPVPGNIVLDSNAVSHGGSVNGKIQFKDGSQGTSGYVWTSTDTVGTGSWMVAGGGANTALSNLASTAVNVDIIPGASNTINLGSSSLVWANTFTNVVTSAAGGTLLTIQASSATSTFGTGGNLNLYAGGPGGSNQASGGSVNITAQGAGGVGGTGGSVTITAGYQSSNTSNGNITLIVNDGIPIGSNGKIQFQDSTQGTSGNIWTSKDTVGSGNWSLAGLIPNATQSTVSGTTGSIIASQPSQGSSYKKVIVYLNALTGTAAYTYPVAFSQTPYVYGLAGGVTAATASTTSVSFTSVGALSGFVFMEGY